MRKNDRFSQASERLHPRETTPERARSQGKGKELSVRPYGHVFRMCLGRVRGAFGARSGHVQGMFGTCLVCVCCQQWRPNPKVSIFVATAKIVLCCLRMCTNIFRGALSGVG